MYAVIKERVVFEPEILKLFPVLAKASNKKTVEFVNTGAILWQPLCALSRE